MVIKCTLLAGSAWAQWAVAPASSALLAGRYCELSGQEAGVEQNSCWACGARVEAQLFFGSVTQFCMAARGD